MAANMNDCAVVSLRRARLLVAIGLLGGATFPAVAQTADENALWSSIKDSRDSEDYRAYLDKYPEGVYAPLAKRRAAQLDAQSADRPSPGGATLPPGAPPRVKAGAPVTVRMTECEGTNNCATWTFLGKQGNGQWPSGDIANLSVDTLEGDSVVIQRADSAGTSAGLTAIYRGTRHGERIGGEFTSAWPGHWQAKSGNWYATIEPSGDAPPPAMLRFCGVHCHSYRLEGSRYVSDRQPPGQPKWRSVMDIGSFTRDSIILHRVDYDGQKPVFTVTMTGKFAKDGNSITDTAMNGTPNPWRLVWGADINSIPGEDQVTVPTVVVAPVVCFPWFFGIVCN